MKRSESYMMAYRHAWRDAIAFVHAEARRMNDQHAVTVLEALAHGMGRRKWEMKGSVLRSIMSLREFRPNAPNNAPEARVEYVDHTATPYLDLQFSKQGSLTR